jgi:glycosyltransferase involved in cell wall biosynthesis
MKILWFPRLQFDIDKLHITTWREICRELEQRWKCDVRIAIAGRRCDNVFNKDYIPIFIIRKKFLRLLTFWVIGYAKFIYHCLIFKPDVVILDIFTIWFSIPFSILPKKKMLIIVDNRTPFYNIRPYKPTWNDKIIEFYTKLSYKYCKYFLDGMTVITDYYKGYVCKNFEFNPFFIGVWGSGADIDMFSPEKVNVSWRPDFLREKFVLMQHGEIGYNRGALETVEAIKFVNNEEIVLVFIGEGGAKNEILRKIKTLDLEKRVYFLSAIPYSEVPTYISYCNCAIMAYPNIEYWNNNNPIKLFEYLAMGKVVICTDMWTFRNVGGDSRCICYIKQNDARTIAKAINYCYENREYLDEWGREGIKIVKENFTWHKQAGNLLSFIEQLKIGGINK